MHKDLYKKGLDRAELQRSKQAALLQHLKERRHRDLDEHRQIPEIRAKLQKLPQKKQTRAFKEYYGSELSLQLSEWLRVRPENLEDWLLVPCPRGQRCMVVACNGRTEVYNKSGRRYKLLKTMLPGDGVAHKSMTLLDCIFVQKQQTFYVLDVLSFGNQDLTECEAQFRFFWLRSKFEEHDGLKCKSEQNKASFKLLERYDFEYSAQIAIALQRYPYWPNNQPELDGFLFYHKEGNYTCGTTPLVCWLFPFMVQDVLNMCVSSGYEHPAGYVEPLQYMAEFDENLAKKKRLNNKKVRQPHVMNEETEEMENSEGDSLQELLDAERRLEMGEDLEEDYKECVTEFSTNVTLVKMLGAGGCGGGLCYADAH